MHDFNGTFFATAATVIPVLFLALTLQGDFVVSVLITSLRMRRWVNKGRRAQRGKPDIGWKDLGRDLVAQVALTLHFATLLVPFDAAWGEIVAIRVLENRRATPADTTSVVQAVIVLTVTAAIALVVRYFLAVGKERDRRLRREAKQKALNGADSKSPGSDSPGDAAVS